MMEFFLILVNKLCDIKSKNSISVRLFLYYIFTYFLSYCCKENNYTEIIDICIFSSGDRMNLIINTLHKMLVFSRINSDVVIVAIMLHKETTVDQQYPSYATNTRLNVSHTYDTHTN